MTKLDSDGTDRATPWPRHVVRRATGWRLDLIRSHGRTRCWAAAWLVLAALAPLGVRLLGEDGSRRPCPTCAPIPPPSYEQLVGVGPGILWKLLVAGVVGTALLVAVLARSIDEQVSLSTGIVHALARWRTWAVAIGGGYLASIVALTALLTASGLGQLLAARGLGAQLPRDASGELVASALRLVPAVLVVASTVLAVALGASWVLRSSLGAAAVTLVVVVVWDRWMVDGPERISLVPGVSLLSRPLVALVAWSAAIAAGAVAASALVARRRQRI